MTEPNLNALIRSRIGQPMSPGEDAVVAVLAKCDQMRRDAANNTVGNTFWVNAITAEFEQVIARALGIEA